MRKIAVFLICSLFLCSCTHFSKPFKKSEYLLGTLVSVTVYDNHSDTEKLVDECFEMIRVFEKTVSFNDTYSELSYINDNAYENPVHISETLFDILQKSLVFCKKSEGKFDIGIGKLIELWGIGTESAQVPSESEIADYKGFNGYKNIILDAEQKTVYFSDKRVKIHLGACAKGYAEDMAVEFLKDNGIKSALLDFGGSISVIGTKPNGTGFIIGVTNPNEKADYIEKIKVSDTSVVTSGDYQRYFVENGVKYHHILDTADGFPADNGVKSVTIICESAFKADCLSTAAFILGEERGGKLIESEKCEYIIYADDCIISDGVEVQ